MKRLEKNVNKIGIKLNKGVVKMRNNTTGNWGLRLFYGQSQGLRLFILFVIVGGLGLPAKASVPTGASLPANQFQSQSRQAENQLANQPVNQLVVQSQQSALPILLAQNLSSQNLEDELDDELDTAADQAEASGSSGGVEILDLNELENNLQPDFEAELDEDADALDDGSFNTDTIADGEAMDADKDAATTSDSTAANTSTDTQLEAELDTENESLAEETPDNENSNGMDDEFELDPALKSANTRPTPKTKTQTFLADTPDHAYESRVYRIYRNFLSTPVSPEQWEQMLGDRGVETYSIQQGDTLWGVSKTFFGDGHYWPKVWSLNGVIFNPHRIDPGTDLTFIMGSESEPPSIAVGAKGDALFEDESTRQQDAALTEQLSPVVGPSGMLKKLPPSLPAYSLRPATRDRKLELSQTPSQLSQMNRKHIVSQYITSRMPRTVGQVKETQTGGQWASEGEYVFVHFRDPRVKVGDRLLAIVDKGRNEKSTPALRGSMGRTIEVQGELELVEKLSRRRFFRARIVKALYPVELGAKLQKAQLQAQKINLQGPRGRSSGQVIGGQYAKKRFFFSLGDVLYINRGRVRGVQEGQVLDVRPNRKLRHGGSRVTRETRSIGRVQIVKTTPRFATAVVVQQQETIQTGDFIAPVQ